MKKIQTILAIAVMALVMASCGGAKSTAPSKTVVKYYELMQKGDYTAAIDCIALQDETAKAQLVSIMESKVPAAIKENGGYKGLEVISEEVAEDGQSANVKVKVLYGNKDTEEDLKLVNKDGKWMLSFDGK